MMGNIILAMLFAGVALFQFRLAKNWLRGLILPLISLPLLALTVYLHAETPVVWPAVSLFHVIAMSLMCALLFAVYFYVLIKYRKTDSEE